jgi:hypothetical protein
MTLYQLKRIWTIEKSMVWEIDRLGAKFVHVYFKKLANPTFEEWMNEISPKIAHTAQRKCGSDTPRIQVTRYLLLT